MGSTNSSSNVKQRYDSTVVRLQAAVALYSSNNNNSSSCVSTHHIVVNDDADASGHRCDAAANGSSNTTTTDLLLSSSGTHSRRSRKAHYNRKHTVSLNGSSITDEHEASAELNNKYDAMWHEERLAHLQVITMHSSL